MSYVKLEIPLSFIQSQVGAPTWQEVLFGIDSELIDPAAARELAVEQLDAADSSKAVLDLAIADDDEDVRPLVESLARAERAEPEQGIRRAWLALTLAWLYRRRDEFDDPLTVLEHVFADFDHPSGMWPMLRYSPLKQRDLGSQELNEARLIDNWREFALQELGELSRRKSAA